MGGFHRRRRQGRHRRGPGEQDPRLDSLSGRAWLVLPCALMRLAAPAEVREVLERGQLQGEGAPLSLQLVDRLT